jgi:hypothetical protein
MTKLPNIAWWISSGLGCGVGLVLNESHSDDFCWGITFITTTVVLLLWYIFTPSESDSHG